MSIALRTAIGPAPFSTLSKSDFRTALDCPTKLYFKEMHYPSTNEMDDYLAFLAHGGYMVEAVAKAMYPEGIVMEYGGDPVEDARRTMEALSAESVTLFEATLLVRNKMARVDILQKNGNAFKLIEVKSKSFDPIDHLARVVAGTGNGFRGVKSPFRISAKWQETLMDVTFQVHLLKALFPDSPIEPYLCMVNNTARLSVDNLPAFFKVDRKPNKHGIETTARAQFIGDVERARQDNILCTMDIKWEVEELLPDVVAMADEFAASLEGGVTKMRRDIDTSCKDCEYRLGEEQHPRGFDECWGPLANVRPSILDLYSASTLRKNKQPLVPMLLKEGKASMFDVDESLCVTANGEVGPVARRQLTQLKHTKLGTEWFGEAVAAALSSAKYPLHFIDFEAFRVALPPHSRMKPWGLIAFQWSCHTIPAPGAAPIHREWLNTDDYWPNAGFARSLMETIGGEGSVLTWTHFERTVLKDVLSELATFDEWEQELVQWIASITSGNRIIDMNQVTKDGYFHPEMGGRTSIKVVLDAIWKSHEPMRASFSSLTGFPADPSKAPYAALPPLVINDKERNVAEGTGAIRAYEAMMYGVERSDPAARNAWSQLLKQYCALDTLAMVLIWNRWQEKVSQPLQ